MTKKKDPVRIYYDAIHRAEERFLLSTGWAHTEVTPDGWELWEKNGLQTYQSLAVKIEERSRLGDHSWWSRMDHQGPM